MTEHLGELLSAYLDGELTEDETAAVEAHLAHCDSCRAELQATRAVRTTLRGAPSIDPPFGFYEQLDRTRHPPRWSAAVSAAAVAAVWVAVVGFAVAPDRAKAVPPIDATRAALVNTDRIAVSVRPVEVDWSQLEGGLRRTVAGLPGRPWESTEQGGANALVYESDGSTVLVVGNVPVERLEQAAREVGDRSAPSVLDHLRDAATALTDAFSLR